MRTGILTIIAVGGLAAAPCLAQNAGEPNPWRADRGALAGHPNGIGRSGQRNSPRVSWRTTQAYPWPVNRRPPPVPYGTGIERVRRAVAGRGVRERAEADGRVGPTPRKGNALDAEAGLRVRTYSVRR